MGQRFRRARRKVKVNRNNLNRFHQRVFIFFSPPSTFLFWPVFFLQIWKICKFTVEESWHNGCVRKCPSILTTRDVFFRPEEYPAKNQREICISHCVHNKRGVVITSFGEHGLTQLLNYVHYIVVEICYDSLLSVKII